MAEVITKCQNCGAEFPTEYRKFGATVECENCHEETVPQIPDGTLIPATEWDMTYFDFKNLISYKPYRKSVKPLFESWFGYQLKDTDSSTLILNRENEAIDLLWLHLKIQDDSEKQYEIYQTAMSLWR